MIRASGIGSPALASDYSALVDAPDLARPVDEPHNVDAAGTAETERPGLRGEAPAASPDDDLTLCGALPPAGATLSDRAPCCGFADHDGPHFNGRSAWIGAASSSDSALLDHLERIVRQTGKVTLRFAAGSSAFAVGLGWLSIGDGDDLREALTAASKAAPVSVPSRAAVPTEGSGSGPTAGDRCSRDSQHAAADAGAFTWCAGMREIL